MSDKNNNIQVAVRCRPLKAGESQILSTDGLRGKTVTIDSTHSTSQQKTYTFDHVFGDQSDQAMLYSDVGAPIVDEMLQGFNCTIFAYGMTGTGKTYTMSMDEKDTAALNPSDRSDISNGAGIIPRALHSIFNKLETQHAECSVRVSYIELYNEELRDLLSLNYKPPQTGSGSSSTSTGDGLKMFGDPKGRGGVIIQGLEETLVDSAEMAFEAFERGSRRRRIASTNCNEYSSRSHSVFTITVHIKDFSDRGDEIVKVGKLNLVDLAGSENIGRSGAVDLRAREAGNINASLLALGRVINGLVERSDKNRNKKLTDKAADKSYIPYRDSKLTRLLQDSLGGETKTFIIATISPSKTSIEETLSTLDYALRAKSIENKPQVQQKTSKNMYINDLVAENVRLKAEFRASVEQNNGMWFTKDKVVQYDYLQDNKEKCEKEREGFVAAEKEHLHTLQKLDLADNEIIIKRNTISKLEKEVDGLVKELEEEKIVHGVREKGELVNWSAAQSWLGHARDEQHDLEMLHGVMENKQAEDDSDRSTLGTYRTETEEVIRTCMTRSTNYTQFIDGVMGEMQSKKTQLGDTLKVIPELADVVLNDSAGKLRDLIAHLATIEEENSVSNQLSTDAIQISGERVSETLTSVVRELEKSSEKFSSALVELLEREMLGFDDKLNALFEEYKLRSNAKVRAMEVDVEHLSDLYTHLDQYAERTVEQLTQTQDKLHAYEVKSTAMNESRKGAIITEVTRLLTHYDEQDATDKQTHLTPITNNLTNMIDDTTASKTHNLAALDHLTVSTSQHAGDERRECTQQGSVWDEVKRAVREVKHGVERALDENNAVVVRTHAQIQQDGATNVDEIVKKCDESRTRMQVSYDSYAQHSQHTTSSSNAVFDNLATSIGDIYSRVASTIDGMTQITDNASSTSKENADDISNTVATLSRTLTNLMHVLNVNSNSSTQAIPQKRNWVGEDAYDMQTAQSRSDVLRAVVSGPAKRSKSFGGDNAASAANALFVGDTDRQGSAPPEMSPRKEGAYTVDARALKDSDAGETFRNTLSNLREEGGDVEKVDRAGDLVMSTAQEPAIEEVDQVEETEEVEPVQPSQPSQPVRRAPQPARVGASKPTSRSTSTLNQGNTRVTRNRAPLRAASTNTSTTGTRTSRNDLASTANTNGKAPPTKKRTVRQ